ncbi:hypothetical protein [Dyella sp. 333MFSha]|uniref:hypothetical protein n=1 Tax=Dyella sp. 333MFSha TaxID=1798240 RepID=UPI000890B397|nr:hypothetical protein [Dyella sp. 333MFSha]SDF39777.1 hypothetical protein SAMN04515659_0855 [Dyella sp. 333MFSha]
MIDGQKVGDTVSGIFYDYVNGGKTKYAAFTLKAQGDGRVVTVTADPMGLFPKQPGNLFSAGAHQEAVDADAPNAAR